MPFSSLLATHGDRQSLSRCVSVVNKGSFQSPCSSHNPLFLIFAFGENKPSQLVDGKQSSHSEMVEIILCSNLNLCSFSSTGNTAKWKRCLMYSETWDSTFFVL